MIGVVFFPPPFPWHGFGEGWRTRGQMVSRLFVHCEGLDGGFTNGLRGEAQSDEEFERAESW